MKEINFEKLRALIDARDAAERDFETKGAAAHYVAAVEASKALKDWLGNNADVIIEHIERAERNRDMWKGQCERQAEAIAAERAKGERMREALRDIDKCRRYYLQAETPEQREMRADEFQRFAAGTVSAALEGGA